MSALLDEIEHLGQEGHELLDVVERIAAQAKQERRARDRAERNAELAARVVAYLAAHPDAYANDVWRALRGERLGSRAAILEAVKDARRVVSPSQPDALSTTQTAVGPLGGRPRPVLPR